MEKLCICGNGCPEPEENSVLETGVNCYDKCCGKFIEGKSLPGSAVELMRSRYSAYVLKNSQYLYDTCSKKLQNIDDIEAIQNQNIQWLGLEIESFSDHEVIFKAYYRDNGEIQVMKEHSYFIEEEGRLKYDSGKMLEAKIQRNDICPCGSGKKYKKCCG